ncbi:hypothetical protein [Mycobacteroides abscessus]|uniref:hypothetical protein n=1 Tax=Mycobacteroides abscessus TaxID=36809 RepID=UPI0009C5D0EF|nr:hypothetical protein [Mycobacteroides abscessus]SKQ80648.1 Uncharacterised protein [Mycobacteroides abscessus subsp. massiliense]
MTDRPRTDPEQPAAGRRRTPSWIRDAAAGLVDRVSKRGMTLPVDVAESFLREQNYSAARQLGVDERNARQYLDDDTLNQLADQLVSTFADEAPGTNLFDLPRTAHISVAKLGRLIAGLGETIQFYGTFQEIDDADRRARIHETAQLVSLAGLIQADHTVGPVAAPPAMLARTARTLTTIADLTDNEDLAAALRRDAMRARSAAAGFH